MRDRAYFALWHVAANAVVGWVSLLPRFPWKSTTFVRVAAHASLLEKKRYLFLRRFHVRIVTGYAAQTAATGAIALTQSHRIVMLQMILVGRRFARGRRHENRQRIVKWLSGPNVLVFFPGLQDSFIPDLVACHADIVREVWSQFGGIHNREAFPRGHGAACHSIYMCRSRAMAPFTTYRLFGKHDVLEAPGTAIDGIRTAAVTEYASCENGSAESDVRRFIPRRHFPHLGGGV